MALELRRSVPVTYADLADTPDDGHRYELIDGTLVVTPAPSRRHQRAVLRLATLLAAAPPELEVLTAPFDVKISEVTALQPDVLVLARDEPADRFLTTPPLLVAEVLSASTRRFDLLMKRSVYEAFGVASYWIVDPDAPSVTVLELSDGTYVEVAAATGEETVSVQHPFPLSTPSALVD